MKMVLDVIGDVSAAKAVEAYTPFRPGNVTKAAIPTSTPAKGKRVALHRSAFLEGDSDEDDE